MKVVILAGGFGTRLAEYTDNIPKPMVPIGKRPIIEHIMETFSKFDQIFLIFVEFYRVVRDLFFAFHLKHVVSPNSRAQ